MFPAIKGLKLSALSDACIPVSVNGEQGIHQDTIEQPGEIFR